MADDLTQIRDYFVEQAKDLGIRIQEKSPATGYRYTADLFDGDKRIGRLYMRKTTVSWKAAGARSVVRLSGSEDVAKLLGKSGVRSETKKQQEDKETDAAGDKERTQEIPKAAEPGAKKTTKSMKIEESAEKPGTDATVSYTHLTLPTN